MDDTGNTTSGEEQITVVIPGNLIAQIDAQVGSAFVDRADFIRSAIRDYLEHIRKSQGTAPSDIG
ncbi:hypothetical protein CYG49_00065 [Candidatus Saccharibacteria bacterium]|nr:MAG: hypothetical protein CYG49_00065 [Candidatus Saccharibacteria bacterium]